MARSKSSNRWMQEHFNDEYVKKAQELGYRSRAAFKLLEIQDKDQLIRPGMTVIDLGAAPGGWSQLAGTLVGDSGVLLATDILPMDPLADVSFVQGDFTEQAVLDEILQLLNGRPVDLVISDMAPNMSGNSGIDQPRAMLLAELALDLACQVLAPGGSFLVKVFQGAGFEPFRMAVRQQFDTLLTRKPKASRDRSREQYLLAKGFRG